jgi:D-alanyl-D-alanine endopeptidase (penicillin-binding protein 7)
MNNQARLLGMKDTTFVDPTGLSNRNQASASDIALLVAAASRLPLMRDYSTTPRWLAEFGGRRIQYQNSNRLIKDPDWDISLQKTGYIVEAGQCVTMRTQVGGRDLVMVLLDAGSKSARSADAERLRKWVLAQQDSTATHAAAPATAPADTRKRETGG